ncbi:S8 family serine peptidase [Streptomyces sp. NPDC050211]|uniref:S8 family peptidase n=1 Tax=Streptomyces sp. NPDC050211 TaxID=3154932 RepID=UPI0034190142
MTDQQWVLDAFAVEDVWAQSQGEGVTVAVVDSGVDTRHPDLAGHVLEGKDFTGAGKPHEDLMGHETAMASIIAAHGHGTDNASGMMGLAPKAKILPLRTLRTDKDPMHDETWAAAMRYAVDQGSKVINMSFGNESGKPLSDGRATIAYAQAHDVVLVAGSGNRGSIAVDESAALPGVIAVGAHDKNGKKPDLAALTGPHQNWPRTDRVVGDAGPRPRGGVRVAPGSGPIRTNSGRYTTGSAGRIRPRPSACPVYGAARAKRARPTGTGPCGSARPHPGWSLRRQLHGHGGRNATPACPPQS